MINGMFKLKRGQVLTPEEKKATDVVNKYLDQFIAADKIVFAFPMWNLTVPAVLHTYIDYLNQAGKTFTYTANGPVGLLTDKKVGILNARGGLYATEPMAQKEMALKYVTHMMHFLGIKDITTVIVEGHAKSPEQAEIIIQKGIEEAAAAAISF